MLSITAANSGRFSAFVSKKPRRTVLISIFRTFNWPRWPKGRVPVRSVQVGPPLGAERDEVTARHRSSPHDACLSEHHASPMSRLFKRFDQMHTWDIDGQQTIDGLLPSSVHPNPPKSSSRPESAFKAFMAVFFRYCVFETVFLNGFFASPVLATFSVRSYKMFAILSSLCLVDQSQRKIIHDNSIIIYKYAYCFAHREILNARSDRRW